MQRRAEEKGKTQYILLKPKKNNRLRNCRTAETVQGLKMLSFHFTMIIVKGEVCLERSEVWLVVIGRE